MNMQSVFENLGGIKGIGGNELAPMHPSEIRRLERNFGCKLPESYSQFLLNYGASRLNGESPDNPFILFRPMMPLPPQFESGRGMLDALYGGKKDDNDPYSIEVRIGVYAGRIPDSLTAIADDGGFGQICLGIRGDEFGNIYYWDQSNEPLDENTYFENYREPRPRTDLFKNVTHIAASFDDFLERLEFMKE